MPVSSESDLHTLLNLDSDLDTGIIREMRQDGADIHICIAALALERYRVGFSELQKVSLDFRSSDDERQYAALTAQSICFARQWMIRENQNLVDAAIIARSDVLERRAVRNDIAQIV